MSSLAHEGNPKEDEIIISGGSVLSTAQLDIDFDFIGGVVPNVPASNFGPEAYPGCTYSEEYRYVEQCPLGLRVIDRYDIGSLAGIRLHGSFLGCSGDPSGGFVFAPTEPRFSVDLLSGRRDFSIEVQGSFAGFSIVQGPLNASHTGNFLDAAVQYDIISYAPVCGFCFWVDDQSTPCNFTGVVAINDLANERSYLGYFINADLHSDPPTILATGAACPTDQVLSFFNNLGTGAFELDKSPGILISSSAVNSVVPSLIPNNPNWGFIWLPNNGGGVHQAKFSWGFANWDCT